MVVVLPLVVSDSGISEHMLGLILFFSLLLSDMVNHKITCKILYFRAYAAIHFVFQFPFVRGGKLTCLTCSVCILFFLR